MRAPRSTISPRSKPPTSRSPKKAMNSSSPQDTARRSRWSPTSASTSSLPRSRRNSSPGAGVARHPVLERRIGHRFQDSALLSQALTHRSFGSPHNERLEFLGDGVIGCVIAEELYARFPDLAEGELSRLRASLVRETAL